MELNDWKQKNNKAKGYVHFDERVNVRNVWSYISNPEKVARHGYYPLIHTQIIFDKFDKNSPSYTKMKIRDIAYSAHIDRLILSYYAFKLNNIYNEYVTQTKIDTNVIAYRDSTGKSNIEYSKDAFDFIKQTNQATIIVGDFTDFFGSLDHKYLKEKMLKLLQCDHLSDDWFGIFKYVTRYVSWELDSLLELNGYVNNSDGIKKFNSQQKALSKEQFKKHKKENLFSNKNDYGIPQGTAISALLSNVYMIEFDSALADLVKRCGGFYNRYSDDFIIVFPNKDGIEFQVIYKSISAIINEIPNLDLQQEKTQVYEYENNNISNINDLVFDSGKKEKDILDYLGFTFDGQKVRFRDKTLTKYYYKLYRKTKGIIRNNAKTKYGNRISNTELYKRFSIRGVQGKFKHKNEEEEKIRNFLSYVLRAEQVYCNEAEILKFRKRHLSKIRKQLKKIND